MLGIREVRYVQPEREGKHAIPELVRVCIELPPQAWRETIGCRIVDLPRHTGAGPCGTLARRPCALALAWSIAHLIEPLRAYYAIYRPPLRFGAKPGPRGRRGIYDEVDA